METCTDESASHGGAHGEFIKMSTPRLSTQSPIETPLGLRRIGDSGESGDFLGFREERVSMRKIVILERELRMVKEAIGRILDTQDLLVTENNDLKRKCQEFGNAQKENNMMKQCMKEIREENELMKVSCTKDSDEWKKKCEDYENIVKANKEMKTSLEKLKEENRALKEKCNVNEVTLQQMDDKVKVQRE